MDQVFLNKLKDATPIIKDLESYYDADEEMLQIAKYIKKYNEHNSYVEPEKIKFLYSAKPKKDGARYVLFELTKRSDMEKMIDINYDFILTVFYDVWKEITPEEKIIQLDKALCGIEIVDETKSKKKAPDSKEYVANMHMYGPDKVMELSEKIDISCISAIEIRKEKKKNGSASEDNDLDAIISGDLDMSLEKED